MTDKERGERYLSADPEMYRDSEPERTYTQKEVDDIQRLAQAAALKEAARIADACERDGVAEPGVISACILARPPSPTNPYSAQDDAELWAKFQVEAIKDPGLIIETMLAEELAKARLEAIEKVEQSCFGKKDSVKLSSGTPHRRRAGSAGVSSRNKWILRSL